MTPITLSLIFRGITAMGSVEGAWGRAAPRSPRRSSPRSGRLTDEPLADGDGGGDRHLALRGLELEPPVFSLTMKRWKTSAPIRLMTISWTMRTTSL